jgi:glucose/arabinose dehydrogenase
VLGAEMPPGGAQPQLDKLTLPAGFSVALYADKVPGARSMALGSDGTVFVGTRQQTVYAVVDRNRDFKADEVLTLATGLTSPNGVAFRGGALYVAEINRILRYDGVLEFAKVPNGASPAPKQTVLTDKLPTDRQHGWKHLAFGPDNMLYTQIGAPGNLVDRGDPYATIIRMKPEGGDFEIFVLDPQFGKDKNCADYTAPAYKLGPHVAALGLKFYAGSMFPAEYRKQLFIVNHGSWNRSAQVAHTGYRIMLARWEGRQL